MNNNPLVSILIPCYNGEQFVAEAIESALEQTYPHVEVIVVDDGSRDNSVEVLKSYGDRIRYEAGPNQGACAARNRAFELSSGEFIQYLDADDVLLPEKLERQVPILSQNVADLTFCKGNIFGDGKPLRPKKSQIGCPEGKDPFLFCLGQGLSTEGPLIRRSLVERVSGFDEMIKRGQEWNFHVRLAAAGMRIHYSDELLYNHRHDDRPGRITQRKMTAEDSLSQVLRLGEVLESNPVYEFHESRRQAYCARLAPAILSAARQGNSPVVRQGIQLLHRLDPQGSYRYSESALVDALSKRIGPVTAEVMLKPVRAVRNLFRKSARTTG